MQIKDYFILLVVRIRIVMHIAAQSARTRTYVYSQLTTQLYSNMQDSTNKVQIFAYN